VGERTRPAAMLRLLMVLLGVVGFILTPGAGTTTSSAFDGGAVVAPATTSGQGVNRFDEGHAPTTTPGVRHDETSSGGADHGLALTPATARQRHRAQGTVSGGSPAEPAGVAAGAPHGRAPPVFPSI
jgi:hypothetical protein